MINNTFYFDQPLSAFVTFEYSDPLNKLIQKPTLYEHKKEYIWHPEGKNSYEVPLYLRES